MLRENRPHEGVPRVEHDHRAREARLRFERLERLLARQPARVDFPPVRRFRLFVFAGFRNGRKAKQSPGSSSDRRPCGIRKAGTVLT